MIDKENVDFFINNNQFYQDKQYKNAAFVGCDNGAAKYVFKRSIKQNYKGEAMGIIKLMAFLIPTKRVNHFLFFK